MNLSWSELSFIALGSLSVMSLIITTLTRRGYPLSLILFSLGVSFTIIYFIQTFIIAGYKTQVPLSVIGMLIAIMRIECRRQYGTFHRGQ